MTCRACSQPYPCGCIACPACDNVAARNELGHACAHCGWRSDRCRTCSKLMTFEPTYRGTTAGGLALVGARACVPCGVYEVCKQSKPAESVDWKVATSGRSVDAGGVRIRAERGQPGEVEALMQRIARLPALELEVEEMRLAVEKRSKSA